MTTINVNELTAEKKTAILKKLNKLQAMAEDVSSPNEAAIAANQAKKLMDKYQLDHADVIADTIDDNIVYEKYDQNSTSSIARWKEYLSVAIKTYTGVEVRKHVNRNATKGSRSRRSFIIAFYGYKDDVAFATYLMDYLIATAERLANDYVKERKQFFKDNGLYYAKGYTREFKTSFLKGFSTGIAAKFRELKKQEEEIKTSSGTSLVVVKDQAIQEKFGDFKYSNRRDNATNYSAHAKGFESGKNTSIHKSVNTSSQGKRLVN